ncbi:MAG: hypothetical protein AAGA96_12390 [Verrucomicrobiota bacterium]
MPLRLREPENQREMDRNLRILCWILILPSPWLLFQVNGYVMAMLLIGGGGRLLLTAIRMPIEKLNYFKFLPYAFIVLTGIAMQFGFVRGWMFLAVFWAFLFYSEWMSMAHRGTKEAGVDQVEPLQP